MSQGPCGFAEEALKRGHPEPGEPSATLGWARDTGHFLGTPGNSETGAETARCSRVPPSEQRLRAQGARAGLGGRVCAWARPWACGRGRRCDPGPGARGACTHVVFLALQLLRKLKLVRLQLVQGVPQLLGLVPGKRQRSGLARSALGGRAPATTESWPGDPRRPEAGGLGAGTAGHRPPGAGRPHTSACPR